LPISRVGGFWFPIPIQFPGFVPGTFSLPAYLNQEKPSAKERRESALKGV